MAIIPARIEFEGTTPVSPDFADSYFMRETGLAESQEVFVGGNNLAERFARLQRGQYFVVGETGFGTGLNCLLAASCFLEHAPPDCRLQLVSVDLHPLTRPDLARALAAFPALAKLSAALLANYPPPIHGQHHLRLAPGIDLILMWGDASTMWQTSKTKVDAWFLDGFAPSRNPEMWSQTLYSAIAGHSRPGATLASFTAAGPVRRGLTEAGFEVERVAGFGGKRHRINARYPGQFTARTIATGHALVAGAGLAGSTSARALAEQGWQVSVIDPAGVATGGSGNLAGVVYSTPSAHLTAQNRFYQSALAHALRWFDRHRFPEQRASGTLNDVVLSPPTQAKLDKARQASRSGAWPAEMMDWIDSDRFFLKGAGFVRPDHWCRHLLDHPAIALDGRRLIDFEAGRPVLAHFADGSSGTFDALVLATAEASTEFAGLDWLPIRQIRGQVSYCQATPASRKWQQAQCHAGYLTPALDDLHCVGATFDTKAEHCEPSDADDQANLDQLRTHLPEHWAELGGDRIKLLGRRAAWRCASPDYLPLCGAVPDPAAGPGAFATGVWLNIAHGSRGLAHTPLCADLIASLVTCPDGAMPTEPEIVAALAPERFILRKNRRKRRRKLAPDQ